MRTARVDRQLRTTAYDDGETVGRPARIIRVARAAAIVFRTTEKFGRARRTPSFDPPAPRRIRQHPPSTLRCRYARHAFRPSRVCVYTGGSRVVCRARGPPGIPLTVYTALLQHTRAQYFIFQRTK